MHSKRVLSRCAWTRRRAFSRHGRRTSTPSSARPRTSRAFVRSGGRPGARAKSMDESHLDLARDRSQPCAGLTQIGLKGRGLDVIDAPAVAKDRPDLSLSYAPRSPIARLLVAEAHQKIGAAEPNDSPEAISEVGTVFVREHMKQPRINDGVE